MPKKTQAELAREFLDLHHAQRMLVLPNAWDVTSARIFEEAGFPAIATSSAAIANAYGYPDGERIPRAEMLAAVRRIVEAVRVPVTADMEAGYGTTPAEVASTVREVLSTGAVGLNLEDSIIGKPDTLLDLGQMRETVRAVAEVGERAGIPLVLNARTDVFLHSIGPTETRLARAIERLNVYRASGAQCLFAPGVTDQETIARLVRGVSGPLNVLAMAGMPPIPELTQLGVKRVSLGSGPMRATLGLLTRMARQLRDDGVFSLMTDGAMTYPDANRLVQSVHPFSDSAHK